MTDIKEQAQQLIELNEKRTPGDVCFHEGRDPNDVENDGSVYAIDRPGHAVCLFKAPRYETKRRWVENATFIAHTANHAPAIAQAYLDKCEEVERLNARGETVHQSVAIVKSVQKQKDYPLSLLAQHAPLLADEVERLTAEVERFREALQEIADRHIPDQPATSPYPEDIWPTLNYKKLRVMARQALGENNDKTG